MEIKLTDNQTITEFIELFVEMTEIHEIVTVLTNTPKEFTIKSEGDFGDGLETTKYYFTFNNDLLTITLENGSMLIMDIDDVKQIKSDGAEDEDPWANFCDELRDLEHIDNLVKTLKGEAK